MVPFKLNLVVVGAGDWQFIGLLLGEDAFQIAVRLWHSRGPHGHQGGTAAGQRPQMSTVNCVHLGLFTPEEQRKCDHAKEVDWLVGPAWCVPDLPDALPNAKVGIMLMQPQLSQEEGVHRCADGDQSDLTFNLLA